MDALEPLHCGIEAAFAQGSSSCCRPLVKRLLEIALNKAAISDTVNLSSHLLLPRSTDNHRIDDIQKIEHLDDPAPALVRADNADTPNSVVVATFELKDRPDRHRFVFIELGWSPIPSDIGTDAFRAVSPIEPGLAASPHPGDQLPIERL